MSWKITALAGLIAIAAAASTGFAADAPATNPAPQGQGMMGSQGQGMMGGQQGQGMMPMMNMMAQMNEMMATCNNMMKGAMQAPNGQGHPPAPAPEKKG